ncbi:MAG: hypothetical protein IJ593_09485 [Lachnospiraceae bacterium]|nr:hypothetical protein [Lachnospiraceae bacterium]
MQTIVKQYDAKVDSKKRITLRDAKYDYYSVTTYDDGSVSLEPKMLVSNKTISTEHILKTVEMIRKQAIKNGTANMTLDDINRIIYEE